MVKKVISLMCTILITLSFTPISWATVDYSGIIESESNWIASLQQPSGAIVMTKNAASIWDNQPHYMIEPYFANLAAAGMLDNPSTTNINVAKNWITWYFNHLNNPDYNGLNGTVYVYYADTSGSIEHSSGTYDSTDSYGATFLTLLKKYYDVSSDSTLLINNKANIEKIADSVIATQQSDGLTYAKPDYQLKYTMDNSEVNEGLKSIEFLERYVLGDTTKANYYKDKTSLNTNGIETYLWSRTANNYKKYYDQPSDWTVFYPDASCQWFPIWNDVIAPRSMRSEYLYFMFNTNHYGWPYLNMPGETFPGAWTAYTSAMVGDKDRTDIFLDSVKRTYIDTGHPWYWFNTEAGHTTRAAKTIRDAYNLALGKMVTVSSNSSQSSCVNDGNLNNSWTGAAADNEWIKIDLGASKQFNRVLIKWGADYADQYKIQVSDDGINFTDAGTVLAGDGGTDDNSFSVQTKRYVKLLFTHRSSANGVILREAEIYYEPVNLALNKTVTASSGQSDAYKSVDGNTTTRWGSIYADNQWYKIDLGSVTSINKVVIDWEGAYDSGYSVQVSADDVNYTTVFSTTAGDGGIDTIKFSTTSARYVKIVCTTRATPYGSSFWEARVYDDSSNDQTVTNYALNKTADASSVQPNSTFTADMAVDGNPSTRWSSAYQDNQWWKVDLGSTVSNIRRVIIRWEAAYDTVYSIQVSTDNVNYTTVYSTSAGVGGVNEVMFIPANARYVKILCTTRATPYGSSFYEFEVYNQ